MRTINKADTIKMLDAALGFPGGGTTIHLPGSGHGRYIVGGIGKSIRLPAFQARHPATLAYVTDTLNAMLRDYPRAETVGSWRDQIEGSVYFDLGSTHERRDTAVYIAGVRSERAIYDSTADTVEYTEHIVKQSTRR